MSEPTPAKLNLEQLLRTGVATARAGNRSAARALFLALTRAYPGDVRVWLGLAGVAESAQEQRAALEQVLAIEPDHPKARQALARLAPPTEPATPVPAQTRAARTAPDPELPPEPQLPTPADQPAPPSRRFRLFNLIAIGVIGLLVVAILFALLGGPLPQTSQETDPQVQPSPLLQTPLAGAVTPGPQGEPAAPAPQTPAAAVGTAAPAPPSPGPQGSTPVANPPAAANLPLGTLIETDGWSTTLLRPDYALILDGSIGELQPAGRFVLALMAISNNSSAPRRIPADLFTLVDNQGRRYTPRPNASSAYLALYQRGQHGDLALEDDIAPKSGMRSVPVLFDVPLDASGLVLTVQNSGGAGWPIESASAPPANAGP